VNATKPRTSGRDADKGEDFFVKKVQSIVPPSFFKEAEKIFEEVNKLKRSDVIDRYMSLHTKSIKIEPYTHNKYLVRTDVYEAIQRGYIAPSMFVKYRRCARELAIEIIETKRLGGVLVTVDQMKSYLRGMLVHKLYHERYAIGDTEVKVESPKYMILGYIDEVRQELDTYRIIEVKSSYNPDVVGAGLQLMSYMYAFADVFNVPLENIEGYIITMKGTYKVTLNENVFNEYVKRLRTILDIALKEDIEKLPPKLSSKLSYRCNTCPYRGKCFSLPDRYRIYSRYFEAMGFTKLVEKKPDTTLSTFFRKGS
jgi:CRISPR/Cas system-associated exonuclease Cas4 (RecB family)